MEYFWSDSDLSVSLLRVTTLFFCTVLFRASLNWDFGGWSPPRASAFSFFSTWLIPLECKTGNLRDMASHPSEKYQFRIKPLRGNNTLVLLLAGILFSNAVLCLASLLTIYSVKNISGLDPGGATPYSGLYGEAPPERGTFFRLQVYKRVGISQVEVNKRVGKSVI